MNCLYCIRPGVPTFALVGSTGYVDWEAITHVVLHTLTRTEKYLCACAAGKVAILWHVMCLRVLYSPFTSLPLIFIIHQCIPPNVKCQWVLKPEFLVASKLEACFVDPQPYEWSRPSSAVMPGVHKKATSSKRRARGAQGRKEAICVTPNIWPHSVQRWRERRAQAGVGAFSGWQVQNHLGSDASFAMCLILFLISY
jgi:hypothetical protein